MYNYFVIVSIVFLLLSVVLNVVLFSLSDPRVDGPFSGGIFFWVSSRGYTIALSFALLKCAGCLGNRMCFTSILCRGFTLDVGLMLAQKQA